MEDKRFTIYEAADYLKVHHNTLRRWILEGKIQVVRLSRQKQFVSQQALDDFIKEHTGTYKS